MEKVAIVIPCRNEEKYIGKCLESIIACNFPKANLEVILCDGESDDDTKIIITGYCSKITWIKVFNNPFRTTPHGLNLGIENSAGADYIIILGAHAEIYPDFILTCIKAFDVSKDIGCTGGIIESISTTPRSRAISKAMSSSFGVGNAYFRTGSKEGYVDTVAFGAYKKEVFRQCGLFDTHLVRNQDDEFNYRIIKAGFKIYMSGNIRSKYYVRNNFQKLFIQYFQYGYWKVFVNIKHHCITTARQLIPTAFMFFIAIGFIFSFVNDVFKAMYILTLALYFSSAFIFAFFKSRYLPEILKIMYAFIILHTAYGSGYIKGIFEFVILKKNKPVT